MRVTALVVLLLTLPTPGLASNAGWWTQAKQGKVVGKLTTMVGAAKLDLGRKALLVGAAAALMCSAVSCDDPLELNGLANLVGEGEDGSVTIRIGLNYDGTLFPTALSGAELATDQINAALDGIHVELLARDSLGGQ